MFAGDVGTGKTALAETFADRSRAGWGGLLLFRSACARGSGSVGEMTQLISSAFDYVQTESQRPSTAAGPDHAGVLLIDEADALAQSRELAQMHHEDRAGVNALIRGIDGSPNSAAPSSPSCAPTACPHSTRPSRRAADIFRFHRPTTSSAPLFWDAYSATQA